MGDRVVIVGAGHSGAQVAIALRQRGFAGSISMIGSDRDLPYERPPLSKEYLLGEKSFERILIRPAAFWDERDVTLRLGCTIAAVDAVERIVTDSDGVKTKYDHLVWATGGAPRRLVCEGRDLGGVHYLRDRADADRLMAEMAVAKKAVVIGGGYVGLEAAAALRKREVEVVLLEALDRVLARVAGKPLSRFYEDEHRGRGVDLRLSARVDCIEGVGGRVAGVRLVDGTRFDADLVVVGIGIEPAVGPLLAAGAAGGNGVRVDARCRTSLRGVFAIGDCALHDNAFAGGETMRVESVQNANDMASTVAREIVGEGEDYAAVPWFWSNQYDLKLQTVGLSTGYDDLVVRGAPASRSFSVIYLKNDAVIALDCVNAVRDYVQGKALVVAGARIGPEALVDTGTALRDLA